MGKDIRNVSIGEWKVISDKGDLRLRTQRHVTQLAVDPRVLQCAVDR